MKKILCPNCNRSYEIADSLIGKKVQCAKCKTVFLTSERIDTSRDCEDQSYTNNIFRDSIHDIDSKGKHFSKEERIKIAIYQVPFVVVFLLFTILCVSLVVLFNSISKDSAFTDYSICFIVALTITVFLFPPLWILFIILRSALKKSILGTLIASILFVFPLCRELYCIALIVQVKKALDPARLNGWYVCPSFLQFKELLNEKKSITHKIIFSVMKIYFLTMTFLLIQICVIIYIISINSPSLNYHYAEWLNKLGTNHEETVARAVTWYRRAAEHGHTEAQFRLGEALFYGQGVPLDFSQALKWFRLAAEQGNKDAQDKLELLNPIISLFEQANNGDAEAAFILALSFYRGIGGVPEDKVEAVKWFQSAALWGYVEAQYNLGLCYDYGIGVEQDHANAVKWYRKAAEQNYVEAQYHLAMCYEFGIVYFTENNTEEDAAKWYRKAAEQGHIAAQYQLGNCYSNGYGVSKDYKKAVEWWEKAAKQGHAGAQNSLGMAYYNGNGIRQNNKKAVEWWRKSAEQGDADAQNNLGWCYCNGIGVTKDLDEAVKWWKKAAIKDYEERIEFQIIDRLKTGD